ncbi:MAG: GTP-binding protein TypA [Ignavibacteria bacterium GWF2_33_9]|nr:MAG: GTP-binding protein TypA [Ignavibacteria bacterium GWF2_33_9]
MRKDSLRNIAIIAHVDHGKTTLVDALLKQSGTFRENQKVEDRIMDSMDLERERGITILAKNTVVHYKDVKINILDTPGHSDFGGEVERSLNMVDGALLLVDSSEGPLPQTRFVLKKSLDRKLPIILVINKIDRTDQRIDEVVQMAYDLFIDLDANDEQIDFKIIYTNAKAGIAHKDLEDGSQDLRPLFDTILEEIPGPEVDDNEVTQFLITNLAYDNYVGQIAIGRLANGSLELNKQYFLSGKESDQKGVKLSVIYSFEGLGKRQVESVDAGDIVAVAGLTNVKIGDTLTDMENPKPLPRIVVDDPTISMLFYVNDSPFAGKEGKSLTPRHIKESLEKEMLRNVSIDVKATNRADCYEVCGRGELQMAVLIETMRREGFEFAVSKPKVITKKENDVTYEPVEKIFIDVPEEFVGVVTEKLSSRKGIMTHLMNHGGGRVNIEFRIPSRGLIGFRSQFLTDTKGSGIMNSLSDGFMPWFGHIPQRTAGALIADRTGRTTSYAAFGMEDRGDLFVEVGVDVYSGMIIGERNKTADMSVNITKEKKLTNMRASSSDATIVLRPPRRLSLDQMIEFIAEDELVEITPQTLRLRKFELDPHKRKKEAREE